MATNTTAKALCVAGAAVGAIAAAVALKNACTSPASATGSGTGSAPDIGESPQGCQLGQKCKPRRP
ncbi:hypothetical protein [Kitasatospora sp. NPDC093558]|uniref:hypothetical protein n=1 Tax=Kitasatospora sp. NPDC093558 TaxID=3155201 RepID=UPI003441233E